MARRTFDVVDVTEIFTHWYAGRSISELSVSLGLDRKTLYRELERHGEDEDGPRPERARAPTEESRPSGAK